ncbi:phenylpyruvate tautomerase PptA (4-oxalocrotonate tautomerase family) [Cytobacillus eiseniae]|uniref:Phenylpyruvate tautomerase PptA (4-oxalocrotonate tautomerase family) n=1 Tax=Cytobacillus eiseniae TaxID=762947 RepID=A0ABS4RD09_9BACI|nr:YolD-like family protein [Cytobacillus eiseniae]MBP2240772.1 phenylpyruvate tautomerase PptA (4-oxalocrotonate tautomerase family) [Cytobacillus eiseniae]
MSKKLQGNGLFESSRMMLPEHKEAFILHQKSLQKKVRPLIDDQEKERLSQIIFEAMHDRKEVIFVLFEEFNDRELRGIVVKVDQQQKKIQLTQEDTFVWINIADIIDVLF